jgi:hypothetical protein
MNQFEDMSTEDIITELEDRYGAEVSHEDGDYYYSINIYDPVHGCRIDMDLAESELYELLYSLNNPE